MSREPELTPLGQQAYRKLRSRFRASRAVRAPGTFSASERLIEIVEATVEGELRAARDHFMAGNFDQSAAAYEQARTKASEMVKSGAPNAAATLASATVGAGLSYLNLQDNARALELLTEASAEDLDYRARSNLAIGLVEAGATELARRVLPEQDVSHEFALRRDEAAQLIQIAEGSVPEDLVGSSHVLLRAATFSNEAGHVAEAARYAIRGVDLLADESSPVLRALLIGALVEALWRTVFESDVADGGVQIAERGDLMTRIESELAQVSASSVPLTQRDRLRSIRVGYYTLIADWSAVRELDPSPGTMSAAREGPWRAAIEFAAKGDLQRALELVEDTDPPWRSALFRTELLGLAGETNRAAEQAIRLSREYPGRAPVDYVTARLLLGMEEDAKALEHAIRARDSLPGRGYSILVARCHASLGNWQAVLDTLAPHADEDKEEVLQLLSSAADAIGDVSAVEYWSRFYRLVAPDSRAQIGFSLALARFGELERAARLSAEALRDFGEVLGLEELFACGQLQLSEFGSEQSLRRATALLHSRFPDSDDAEYYRLILLSGMGFPSGAHPIDYARLEAAGHVQAATIDDLVKFSREQRKLAQGAYRMYQRGWLPFESYCRLVQGRTAEIVEQLAEAAQTTPVRLRTPLALRGTHPPPSLQARVVLASDLELLIAERIGLMPAIKSALGEAGRLVLYKEVWHRIVEDSAYLEHTAQRGERDLHEQMLRLMASDDRIHLADSGDRTPDKDSARRSGRAWVEREVDDSDESSISASALIAHLKARGALTADRANGALRILGLPATTASALERAPSSLSLEPGLFELLYRAEVIQPLLDTIDGGLWLGGEAVRQIRGAYSEFQQRAKASELARKLHVRLGDGLRAGWVVLQDERPTVTALPSLRPGVPGEYEEFVVRPLQDALSYRESLVQNPTWIRLVADFVGTDGLGDTSQLSNLDWKGPASFREFTGKYREVATREVTLPEVVRALAAPEARQDLLLDLARLGFQDALAPKEILALSDAYGGLDGDVAQSVLSKLEGAAGDPGDTWADLARLKLASVYAEAMWRAIFDAPDRAGSDATCRTLLTRVEGVDRSASSRLLEQVVGNLAVLAVDKPMMSLLEKEDGLFVPSTEAPIARLWGCVRDWAVEAPARLVASRRGLSYGWNVLDRYRPGGPQTEVGWLPLVVARDILFDRGRIIESVPHPDATVGVLSALWEQKPLRARVLEVEQDGVTGEFTVEEILQSVATDLGQAPMSGDEVTLRAEFIPRGTEVRMSVEVPHEAALLRANVKIVPELARNLATVQGSHDGRAYRLLMDLAHTPDDEGVRRRLARASCTAPFKLVRDNPEHIVTWGTRGAGDESSYPSTVGELRELLSEPSDGLGVKPHAADSVSDRLGEGGAWADRLDARHLLEVSSRMPGALAALGVTSLEFDLEEEIGCASHSEHVSVGAVARCAARLTTAAALRESPEERESAAKALSGLLRRMSEPGDLADSLSVVEPSVLATVESCVVRVVAPTVLPARERAWLTHRLYEWLFSQLVRKSLEEQRTAWTNLTAERSEELGETALANWRSARLAAVLHSVLDVVEPLVVTGKGVGLLTSLRESLVRIANGDSVDDAREYWQLLDWRRSRRCERLAGDIALWIAPDCYFALSSQWRLRALQGLPASDLEEAAVGLSVTPLVRAISARVGELSQAEKDALLAWLRALGDSEPAFMWKWACYGELYRCGDGEHRSPLRELLLRNTRTKTIGAALGLFLIATIAQEGLPAAKAELGELAERAAEIGNYAWLAEGLESLASWPDGRTEEMVELLRWAQVQPKLIGQPGFEALRELPLGAEGE